MRLEKEQLELRQIQRRKHKIVLYRRRSSPDWFLAVFIVHTWL